MTDPTMVEVPLTTGGIAVEIRMQDGGRVVVELSPSGSLESIIATDRSAAPSTD